MSNYVELVNNAKDIRRNLQSMREKADVHKHKGITPFPSAWNFHTNVDNILQKYDMESHEEIAADYERLRQKIYYTLTVLEKKMSNHTRKVEQIKWD